MPKPGPDRARLPKDDPMSPKGTKFVCPWGETVPQFPSFDCSPKSKRNWYEMCKICKEYQERHREISLGRLPEFVRSRYGPDESGLTLLDRKFIEGPMDAFTK